MTATTIRVQMAQRKDTAANWTSANPILLSGEIGYETDTKKFKIGNGSSNWNSLAYLPIPDGSGDLTITGNLEIGSTGSLTFEGSTADAFETTLAVTNPTADRTITLPDRSGTVITSGDTGTVTSTMLADGTIVNADINASAAIAGTKISPDFGSQNVTTTGLVGLGTLSPRYKISLGSTAVTSTSSPDTIDLGGTYSDTAGLNLKLRLYWDGTVAQGFGISASQMDYVAASNAAHVFYRGSSEVARFDNAGSFVYGTSTTPGADIGSGTGFYYQISTGLFYVRSNGSPVAAFNRGGNDGTLVEFKQDQTTEGTISVSGTTVSYNGAHLSRWSQLPSGAERTEILRGTVLSNIDEMCEWSNEDNDQLNRMKVSDVEGDKNVSGVFQAWDDDDDTYTNDFYCAMTGDFIIRIGAGITVDRGDLLMSAGDGTAKPQDDDIIRSKTIAKVTSTNVSCTYEDGSYCVPCVLMAC